MYKITIHLDPNNPLPEIGDKFDIVVFEDGEIGEVQAWYANGRWLIMRHSYFYGLAIFIIYESLFKRVGKL